MAAPYTPARAVRRPRPPGDGDRRPPGLRVLVARGRGGGAAARRPAATARRDPPGVHLRREERRHRENVRGDRHVRLHPGPSHRVHAAALQLLPDPALLGARPHLGGGRRRADPRRRRDGAARVRARAPLAAAVGGASRGADRGRPSLLDLARRPHQPRDPRRLARSRDLPRCDDPARAPVPGGRGLTGRDLRVVDPRRTFAWHCCHSSSVLSSSGSGARRSARC